MLLSPHTFQVAILHTDFNFEFLCDHSSSCLAVIRNAASYFMFLVSFLTLRVVSYKCCKTILLHRFIVLYNPTLTFLLACFSFAALSQIILCIARYFLVKSLFMYTFTSLWFLSLYFSFMIFCLSSLLTSAIYELSLNL